MVILALEILASHNCQYNNVQILLRIDNTTAVLYYINKMGSVTFERYNKSARNIWK